MDEPETSFDDQLRQAIGEVTMQLFDALEKRPFEMQNARLSNIAVVVIADGDYKGDNDRYQGKQITDIRYRFRDNGFDRQVGLTRMFQLSVEDD